MNNSRRTCHGILNLAAIVVAAPVFAAETNGVISGTWTTAAAYPLFVSEHNATVVENRIYVAGGFAGPSRDFAGTTSTFHAYDPSTDRWTSLPPLPKKLHHFGIGTLANRIYVTGGFTDEDFELDNKSAYVFDPQAAGGGSWAPIADLPGERAAHSSVAVGGLLYVIGGVGYDPAALLAFNPATNSWDTGRARLPTLREHLTAAVVNDRIYVISGRWSAGNVNAVEEYDPATNRWTAKAAIPTPRSGITSGVIDRKIHVTAGEGHPSGATLASHEVYDPATDTWTTFPSMPTARHGLASGVVNGRWYVIGGGLLEGGGTFESLSNIVEAFSVTPNLDDPMRNAGRLANVSVLSAIAAPGQSPLGPGLTVGFVVARATRAVLIRAVGPTLGAAPFNLASVVADPQVVLYSGTRQLAENDDWGGTAALSAAFAQAGAFSLLAGSRDAALVTTLTPGNYSVQVRGAGGTSGTVLVEVYEVP